MTNLLLSQPILVPLLLLTIVSLRLLGVELGHAFSINYLHPEPAHSLLALKPASHAEGSTHEARHDSDTHT